MGDCCNGQDFAAESMGVRSALWIVGILNALTFALKITAEIAPLDILRDAFIYGVALYVVLSRLGKGTKSQRERWYEPSTAHRDPSRCSSSMQTCLRC